MGYVNTQPKRKPSVAARGLPVHCPFDSKGIWSQDLFGHLRRPEAKGGHGMTEVRASLYASRTIAATTAELRRS